MTCQSLSAQLTVLSFFPNLYSPGSLLHPYPVLIDLLENKEIPFNVPSSFLWHCHWCIYILPLHLSTLFSSWGIFIHKHKLREDLFFSCPNGISLSLISPAGHLLFLSLLSFRAGLYFCFPHEPFFTVSDFNHVNISNTSVNLISFLTQTCFRSFGFPRLWLSFAGSFHIMCAK